MAIDRVLVVDDETIIRKSFEELLRARRYGVTSAANLQEAQRLLARDHFDLLFLDIRLPDGDGTDLLELLTHDPARPLVVMMSGVNTVDTAIECMRIGAFDYLIKPFSLQQIEVAVKKAEAHQHMVQSQRYFQEQLSESNSSVGDSATITHVRALVRKVAATTATVLIEGEIGAGAELVAREIYHRSARSQSRYIEIHCADSATLETSLFGSPKGSADPRDGAFEMADGGTLLLREVGGLSLALQERLLRLLNDGEIAQPGRSKPARLDVRILVTTSQDLWKAVAAGRFREDLFHRLNLCSIRVPSLRERREDIPALAEHFLARACAEFAMRPPAFSPDALRALRSCEWPGNLRELEHTIERALHSSHAGEPITPAALGLAPEPIHAELPPLRAVEREHIFRALRQTQGNKTRAAELLEISIRTLRNKLNEYRLEPA